MGVPRAGFFSLTGSGFLSALSIEGDAQLFWYWYAGSATLCGPWSRFVTRIPRLFVSRIEIHVLEVVHLLVPTMSYVPPISWRYPGVGLACSSDSISCQSEPEDTNRKPLVGAPAVANALCQVFLGPEQWLLRDVLAYYRGAPLRQGD